MIEKLLPLTKNKLEILNLIYSKGETHMLDMAKELKIHPFSLQKTLKSLEPFILQKKAGRTILLSLDHNVSSFNELLLILEDFKLRTNSNKVNSLIKQLHNLFNYDNVIICALFGSYARLSFNENSDIDILLVVKKRDSGLKERISQFSALMQKDVSPLIMQEQSFIKALKNKEPALISLKEPSQRILIRGVSKFLDIFNKEK
jgi:predicted nucleotidyltransferase